MKIPNPERIVIAPAKLTEYLLNVEYERGDTKAQLLRQFGYIVNNWQQDASSVKG